MRKCVAEEDPGKFWMTPGDSAVEASGKIARIPDCVVTWAKLPERLSDFVRVPARAARKVSSASALRSRTFSQAALVTVIDHQGCLCLSLCSLCSLPSLPSRVCFCPSGSQVVVLCESAGNRD